MRVIAGSAGGIQLEVPKFGVRPTMDRVKGAIFSSLGDRVEGARVLDLFSGTGALGIEALSRGAASALFIDQDGQAVCAIERNLKKANLQGSVRQQEVFAFLDRAKLPGRFHIIFADPPYERSKSGEGFTEKLLENPSLLQILEPDGIFILEKRPGEELPENLPWQTTRRKTYGATEVLFLSAMSDQRTAGNDQP